MPQARPIQTNVTAGEVSPRFFGRSDLQQFTGGAAALRNVLALPTGGWTRRSGSLFVGLTASQGAPCRQIAFVISNIAAYMIELGNQYAVFRRNRGLVIGPTGVAVTLPTPWLSAELRGIRYRQVVDVMYVTHPNHPPQKISRTSANAFTIQTVSFADGPYGPENTGDIGATGTAIPSAPDSGTSGAPPLTGSDGTGSGGTEQGSQGEGGGADPEGGPE